jgi:hypothetical protein
MSYANANAIIVTMFFLLLIGSGYYIFKNKKYDCKKCKKLNIFGKKPEPETVNYQNWDGTNDSKTFIL